MTSRRHRRPSHDAGRAGADSGSARTGDDLLGRQCAGAGPVGGVASAFRPVVAEGLSWGLDPSRPASLRPGALLRGTGLGRGAGARGVGGRGAGRPHLWPAQAPGLPFPMRKDFYALVIF